MFKVNNKDLIILVVLYLLTRLVFIFTSPYAYHGEEGKVVSLAVDLIKGKLKLPFFGYLDSPHSGGSIFTSLSAIPFFLVLGNTYLAQKLTALLFSLLTFILFLRLFKKNYPVIFTYFLGFFFCFSTPHYIQKSVMHQGNLVELIFFITLAIYIFHSIFLEGKKSLLNFLSLGYVCGLGFWIQYGQLTAIITLLIFWYAFDKLFFVQKQFFLFFFSFFIGLSPWLYYNIKYDFASFTSDANIINCMYRVINFNISGFSNRLLSLLLIDLPKSFHFLNFSIFSAKAISYIFYSVLFILILYLLWINRIGLIDLLKGLFPISRFNLKREKINLEILFIFYLIISTLMFCYSGFPVGGSEAREWSSMNYHYHHYILFIQPFIFALASISLGKLMLSKRKINKLISKSIIVLVLPLLILSFLNIVSFMNFNKYLFESVYNPNGNAYECGFSYALNPSLFRTFAKQMDKNLRGFFFEGVGEKWSHRVFDERFNDELFRETLQIMNDREKIQFFYGIFNTIKRNVHNAGRKDFFEPIQNVYRIIMVRLNEEEKIICTEVFSIIENEIKR